MIPNKKNRLKITNIQIIKMGISCIAKMVVQCEHRHCECLDGNIGPSSCKANKHYCSCYHYEPFKCRSGLHSCSCILKDQFKKIINRSHQCRSLKHRCYNTILYPISVVIDT
jgi:hypothetical protein